MSAIVQNQYSSWQAENSAKFIYNGFIYVGQVDTDPEIEANQVRVYYIDENEQEVNLTQPIRTNSSGFPVISKNNPTVIQIRAESDYSVKVLNTKGAQEWYIPKASTLSQIINHNDTNDRNATNAHDGIYTRNFETVEQLRAQTSLDGTVVKMTQMDGARINWLGYYSANDGGGNTGLIRVGNSTTLTDDGGSIFIIVNDADNGVWIEADISGKSITPRHFGARANLVDDDAAAIQKAVGVVKNLKGIEGDTYLFKTTVAGVTDLSFNLNGSTLMSEWISGSSAGSFYPRLMFDVVNATRFKVFGGTLHGGRPDTTSSAPTTNVSETSPLVVVRDSENVYVEDNLITNYGSAILDVGGPVLFEDSPYGWAAVKILNCENVNILSTKQTNCRREGIFVARSKNVTYHKNIVENVRSNYITAFHFWYCDGVVFKRNIIDVTGGSRASVVNGYSANVDAVRNIITGTGAGGYSADNERGEVFTATNYNFHRNILINCKFKGDLKLNTIFENINLEHNYIMSDDNSGQCIYLGGVVLGGKVSNNTLVANGASVILALRLSSYLDGSLQPQQISSDIRIFDNTLIGNGSSSVSIPLDIGVRNKVSGLYIYDNRIRDAWTGIYARNVRDRFTLINFNAYNNDIVIPSSVPTDLPSGYGVCFIMTVDQTDTNTDSDITVSSITLDNNQSSSNLAPVYMNFISDPVKNVNNLDNINVLNHQNISGANLASFGIRLIGNERTKLQGVKVNNNTFENYESGTLIEVGNFNGADISYNEFCESDYNLTLSGTGEGILRVENNINEPAGAYRYSSSFTNNITKKFVNNNGLYSVAGGFSATDFGNTANRPDSITDVYIGYTYYDGQIGKPIYWDGAAWRDAAGTLV